MIYSKRRKNLGKRHKKRSSRKSYSQNKTCRSIQNAGAGTDWGEKQAYMNDEGNHVYIPIERAYISKPYSVPDFGVIVYDNIQYKDTDHAELLELQLFKDALKEFIVRHRSEKLDRFFSQTQWLFGSNTKLVDEYTRDDAKSAIDTLRRYYHQMGTHKHTNYYHTFEIKKFIDGYLPDYENRMNEIKTWCRSVGCNAYNGLRLVPCRRDCKAHGSHRP